MLIKRLRTALTSWVPVLPVALVAGCMAGVARTTDVPVLGVPAAVAAPAGTSDIEGKTVAVLIEDEGGAGQSLRAAEALAFSSLREAKARVLERSLLDQLKGDALLRAAIQNRNASVFREIGQKYQTDLIVFLAISAEAERGLGRYWISAATASGYMASTKSAEILGSGVSVPMGTPSAPSVVGETALEAKDRAVRQTVGSVLAKLGLPADVGSIPTDLRLDLRSHWKRVMGTSVTSVAFAMGSRVLISGLKDGSLHVWDVVQGGATFQAHPHSSVVRAIAVSADEQLAATGGDDGKIALMDLASGRVVRDWSVGSKVSSVSFSRDARTIGAATSDGRLVLIDVQGVTPFQTVQAHAKRVTFLAFSRDGRKLISMSDDLTVRGWSPARPQQPLWTRQENIFRGNLTNGALSPDGEFLALGTKEIDIDRLSNRRTDTRKVRVVYTETGGEIHHFRAHDKDISSLAFGASRRVLASGAEDGDLKVWDAERARELYRVSLGRGATVHALAFSRNGEWLAVGAGDAVMVWKIE